jgi:hypothetical protein
MFRALALAFAFTLVACGAPKAGDSCNTAGFLCADNVNALECQNLAWRQLPCRGPSGCRHDGATIRCDMSLDVAGDACASTAVGSGLCSMDAQSHPITLECRNDPVSGTNSLVQTYMCRTCTVTTNSTTGKQEITCQP